jgi:hypothetical protein
MKTECPQCKEIALEFINTKMDNEGYVAFDEYRCSECNHYQTQSIENWREKGNPVTNAIAYLEVAAMSEDNIMNVPTTRFKRAAERLREYHRR